MAKSKLKWGLAALGLMLASAVAVADGLFPNFPIVGGASYCGGYSTGVSGQVCTVTVPAGPSALTGAETFPADTHLSQGQTPQTVAVPVALVGGGVQSAAPLTGTTVAVNKGVNKLLLNPAATIAALTVTLPLPANLLDGQLFTIYTTNTVTTLTLTPGSGSTVTPSITTVTAAAPVKLVYLAANKAWQVQ